MSKDADLTKALFALIEKAQSSIDYGDYEAAIPLLQNALETDDLLISDSSCLNDLAYCYLRLGWFSDAIHILNRCLELDPSDLDARFYRASAYASLKWTEEAMKELKTILTLDPTDILSRHDLALCYRDKGWLKDALEEMKRANAYAMIYGNSEEKDLVESSLTNLEQDMENEDDDDTPGAFWLFVLLAMLMKLRRNGRK
jgi:tetratricopeptide (TPR) repeat protein